MGKPGKQKPCSVSTGSDDHTADSSAKPTVSPVSTFIALNASPVEYNLLNLTGGPSEVYRAQKKPPSFMSPNVSVCCTIMTPFVFGVRSTSCHITQLIAMGILRIVVSMLEIFY